MASEKNKKTSANEEIKDKINKDDISLEEGFKRLEEITDQMRKDDISLEDRFRLYKEGMNLVKLCGSKIDVVEKELILVNDASDAKD